MKAKMSKTTVQRIRLLVATIVPAFLLFCFWYVWWGAGDFSSLAKNVRKHGTSEQWHNWAAQLIERSETNSNPIPLADWPAFVRLAISGGHRDNWELAVNPGDPNTEPIVQLASVGGFESIGVDIGSTSFVRVVA